MAETFVLSKILLVREKEKDEAQKAYFHSREFFEEIATRLYTLLRKKEDAEESYENYIQTTTPLDRIKEQIAYIEKLNKQILSLQSDVQEARNEMERKQTKLTNAYVEVKKYEKVIEKRKNAHASYIRKKENESMDEISLQRYLNKKIR